MPGRAADLQFKITWLDGVAARIAVAPEAAATDAHRTQRSVQQFRPKTRRLQAPDDVGRARPNLGQRWLFHAGQEHLHGPAQNVNAVITQEPFRKFKPTRVNRLENLLQQRPPIRADVAHDGFDQSVDGRFLYLFLFPSLSHPVRRRAN